MNQGRKEFLSFEEHHKSLKHLNRAHSTITLFTHHAHGHENQTRDQEHKFSPYIFEQGALVAEPQANGPAAKAGIESGDVITSVNGTPVKDARDLARKPRIARGSERSQGSSTDRTRRESATD